MGTWDTFLSSSDIIWELDCEDDPDDKPIRKRR